jgi:MFS transporter, PAT family, beta-lactamase induction signal transducer AmpG
LRNSILLSLMAFLMMLACNYMDTILTVFTVQGLGWTDKSYAEFFSTASLIGGLGGMVLGGVLIDRFGKKSILQVCFLLFIVWALGLVTSKEYWADRSFIFTFMIGHRTIYVLASICLFAAAMECCWKKISATQFTLYMTIGNLGRNVGAALVGTVKSNFDWQIALSFFAIFIVLSWIVLQFIHVKQQVAKVEAIERLDHYPKNTQNQLCAT